MITENGKRFDLSRAAIEELRKAKTADVAEKVFGRLAPHIACRDRAAVWQAV